MKTFMADWRNPALLAAGVLMVLLIVFASISGSQSMNKRIVTVGGERITRQDVLNEIKRQGGDRVLLKMIDDTLFEKYAEQQKVAVTDNELEQILKPDRLRAAVGGMTLEEAMANRGMTIDDLRHEYTLALLRMKLTVPEEEIKAKYAELAKTKKLTVFPYTLPACYRYHRYIAPGEQQMKELVAALQKSDTPDDQRIAEAAALSMDSQSSKPFYYVDVDGTPSQEYPELLMLLPTLKPGEISKPVTIELPQVGMKGWVVVQLDSVTPEQKPTLENCSVQIGLTLMQGEKFEERLQKVKMEAFQQVEITFASEEFKEAKDIIDQQRRESIPIPGPQGPILPNTGPNGAVGPQPAGPPPAGPQPPASGGK